MSNTIHLLYKTSYEVNDNFSIVIPTVGQILDCESEYYALVSIFTSMPIDMMVYLDDAGINFSEIDDYQLFLMLSHGLKEKDTSLLFNYPSFENFELEQNTDNGDIVFRDPNTGIMIDRGIYNIVSNTLRKIHHMKKDRRKPANEEANKYMIERARAKMKRESKRHKDSELESLIVAMVNTEQFKYNLEETRNLTIYQFNECVLQTQHKIDFDNIVHGIYAGNVDGSKVNPKSLNWMVHD